MDVNQIKTELRKLGTRPNKLMGQNFLVDNAVLDDIIKTADIKKGETVVEIGPGLGVLTSKLIRAGANVIAIEQDRKLGEYLRKKFKGYSVDIIIANAVLKIQELRLPSKYKAVSNLPYSITSPVINMFLTKVSPRPQEMVLMVQKEVAERLTAKIGSRDRGVLTVVTELASEKTNIVKVVEPQSFWPEPKVDSAILKISVSPTSNQKNVERIVQVVKMGFSKKRAKIKNAFEGKIENPTSLLQSAGIDPNLRAEDLTPEMWKKLADSL